MKRTRTWKGREEKDPIILGTTYTYLTALECLGLRPLNGHNRTFYRVRCKCGKEFDVPAKQLKSGGSKSCGCLRCDTLTRHGETKNRRPSRTYNAWSGMIKRCTNPKAISWKNYGGRGIKVCERWREFRNFFEDMGTCPESYSIDRIDNEGHYEPGNCRWATRSQQSRNTRIVGKLEINGITKTTWEWAELCGLKHRTITWRIRNGYSPQQCILPLHSFHRKHVSWHCS